MKLNSIFRRLDILKIMVQAKGDPSLLCKFVWMVFGQRTRRSLKNDVLFDMFTGDDQVCHNFNSF
jgi:hypothetical protein